MSIHRLRYFRLSWLTEGRRWIAQPPQGQNTSIHSTTGLKTADLHDLTGLEIIPQRQRRKLTRGGIGQGIPPAMTTAIDQTLFTQKVGVL